MESKRSIQKKGNKEKKKEREQVVWGLGVERWRRTLRV